jgi:hypothetical protein
MGRTISAALFGDLSFAGLTSPLLSWLGSAGLVVFFGWHLAKLFADAARASAPFVRLRPLLSSLAERGETADLRRAYDRAFSDGQGVPVGQEAPDGIDLQRLSELDESMRGTGGLRRPWVQFRKTLLIEHVPWFGEPRIFSTRRAEDFFTREAVLADDIDLAFYERVPALITGFGLLFTFVAICIGLGRLHAEGPAIVGIQGLINGLAGKFLTSIVGLVCANLFVLLEQPAVRRLSRLHAEFLALLDESFPRRTTEDLLDALAHRPTSTPPDRRTEGREPRTREAWNLAPSIEELTAAVRALSDRVQAPRESEYALATAMRGVEEVQSRTQAEIRALAERLAAVVASTAAAMRSGPELRPVAPSATGDMLHWRRRRGRRIG